MYIIKNVVVWTAIIVLSVSNVALANDSAEVSIGERLFLETRFAQSHFVNPGKADPALDYTLTMHEPLRGPFAGKTMNCRSCHMVDEHRNSANAGIRSYSDFSHTSPIPDRKDKNYYTARNSMSLVNITIPGNNALFHFDGEFNSMEDLVRATLTGRNYGWQATERQQAIKHIANVIRKDNGQGKLASEFGGSYRKILKATDTTIPFDLVLPKPFRLDVNTASDKQIFDAIARLIAVYVIDLGYERDKQGRYNASPYDQFLILNDLPRKPKSGESDIDYSHRLLTAVNKLSEPKFVNSQRFKFKNHKQSFQFSQKELDGMKLFFTKSNRSVTGGNCVACHPAPHFSDFKFHNIGMTQFNYDRLHETGAFNKLIIPELKERNKNYDQYLPKTEQHPTALAPFKQLAGENKPGVTDLGMWNIFANPDIPAPQQKLKNILCEQAKQQGIKNCSDENLLPLSIASFKTPVLRNLSHSEPYMHNGEFTNLKDAVSFYMTAPILAQQGLIRNPDPALQHVKIALADFNHLVAFLESLNEDYE